MADEENRSCVVNQEVFKKVKGLDIKVVGGFIQHKEIGGPGEETGEHEALALPTGKNRNKRTSLIGRKEKILQIAEDVTNFPVNGNCIIAVADVFYGGLVFVQLLKELVGVADL